MTCGKVGSPFVLSILSKIYADFKDFFSPEKMRSRTEFRPSSNPDKPDSIRLPALASRERNSEDKS